MRGMIILLFIRVGYRPGTVAFRGGFCVFFRFCATFGWGEDKLPAVVKILLLHGFGTLLSTILEKQKSRQGPAPNGVISDGFCCPHLFNSGKIGFPYNLRNK